MKRIVTIVLILIAVMFATGFLFDRCYKKFWWPFFDKLDVVIKDTSYYDGIYLGDSRTHFGINPYYVDSVLKIKTYNIGMGGANISETNFLAATYMKKHTAPKFAVIAIGYSNIFEPNNFFENPCYYFFYNDDTSVNHILQKLGYHTSIYKILPITKYTAFDDFNKFSIAENLRGKTFLKPGGIAYNGFISNSSNTFNVQDAEKAAATDTGFYKGMTMLEETINLFKKNNTLPILVFPPASHANKKAPVEMKIDSAATSLAERFSIPLLHYDNDSSFTQDLFTDQWHLNIKGTVLYSKKLAQDLQAIIKK